MKKIKNDTELLIILIEETISLKNEIKKLNNKIHSKYYEVIKQHKKNTNGLLIKESRGRKILHTDDFYNNLYPTQGYITFD